MGKALPFLTWSQASLRLSRNPEQDTKVSENYKFYAAKMAELRVYRASTRPLHGQLLELFVFVKRCEAQWK
jgi:hypothetical protein